MGLFSYIFGSDNARNIKKLQVIADKVVALESKYKQMNEEDLKNQTNVLKQRLNDGETLDKILPDAYAVVREASDRVLNKRHYYVQILGGIALHQGRIAEMKTGEGKTLVETLPAYLNALTGKGVHIVTVNEYLAQRDSEWMGKIFTYLGLTVGLTLSGMSSAQKREAYKADITYGTNSEFGFDYLRDNMVVTKEQRVQRGTAFAIVDEVDSILIDEARTPLIISGGQGVKSADSYLQANRFARMLKKEEDVDIDEKTKQIRLTESGVAKAERYYKIPSLSDSEYIELNHYINNAVKAQFMMTRDINYIVDKNEVLIVDEFTGRILKGRRYSDGLHQAIEAKEGVPINESRLTVATITYQNYFRLYTKLSGMTGTAKTEEIEFNKIYALDVVCIPTNKPIIRIDRNDIIYQTRQAKLKAIVRDIAERNAKGQPVLVGTTTVEKSEELSAMLVRQGVKHNVLNAKNHEREGEIIAQAGKVGMVTLATNMAGRGTDILLGGNAEYLARQALRNDGYTEEMINNATSYFQTDDPEILAEREKFQHYQNDFLKETEKEKQQVLDLGGLYVIGTEKHESRRIDNQLRGRSGRQGDKGESIFYCSLEDDVARIFGGDRLKNFVSGRLDPDEPLMQNRFITHQIEAAQQKIEGANFASRRAVLQFDNVLSEQRRVIYEQRNRILDGLDVHEQILSMIRDLCEKACSFYADDSVPSKDWDVKKINSSLEDYLFPRGTNFLEEEDIQNIKLSELIDMVYEEVVNEYEEKIKDFLSTLNFDFAIIERKFLLDNVDKAWVNHIDTMEQLKTELSTREDPINTYRKEGSEMFDEMTAGIRENTAKFLVNARFSVVQRTETEKPAIVINSTNAPRPVKKDQKVGRNDPCPCGSGRKYKNCCGKNL